jgi:quinol monooxygenase YgiN
MHVILVQIHVKPESLEAFREATLANARASLAEPGVARFDVLQQQDDPTRFALVEAYRTAEDHGRHRQTAHYAAWAEAVAPMMAEQRVGTKFSSVFPDDGGW